MMTTLLAVPFFLVFISIVSSAPSAEQCQSLLQVSSANIQCTPHGDCTGLTCVNSITSINSTFTVDKCQDPVLVNVSVIANGTTYQRTFNQSTTVTSNSYLFNWTMSRNASYVQVKGILQYDNSLYTLIPSVAVPLNASICMCQSIQSSIQLAEQSPVSENCVTNSQCTGMECTISLGDDANYTIESDIQSCSDPPGFLFTVRKTETGQQVFQHFFDSSTNATSLFNFPLIVVVIHKPYSIIIGVNWVIEDFPLLFIPRTQIILDKTNCSNETYPSPSPTPISQVSCNAIKQVAINTYCRTNPACDTLDCIAQSYRSLYQILPCSNPPAIHVTLYDFQGNVIFNRAITNHTIVSLPYDFELMITVNHDKPDAFGIEAVIKDIIVTSYSILVVPYTEIPIDSCVCPGVVCSRTITTYLPTVVTTATSIAQTTTTSVTPTTASSIVQGSKNIIYTIIGSVVITATVTVIIMLVILGIVLMIRKGRRSKRQYNFQHLPFDGKDDSTEKMITADYKTVEESTVN